MEKVKEFKQFGAYGLILEDNQILLIKKVSGPYDGKLDLPGGTIEFGETPEVALKRELLEEVGIEIKDYDLYDANSVTFDWEYNNMLIKVHHMGIFYLINNYANEIKKDIEIDEQNDDSLGAEFYDIDKLNKNELSKIVILMLEKLGYRLK
ncbi:MAG: NUDIX domain-containing protein [Firmicutes bacterium]|nr:NUDIX domain-containing protein [Bacillota bacterium]